MAVSRERIRQLVKSYQRRMGLDGWDIDVRFVKGLMTEGEKVTGTCEARHRYQDAVLEFDLAQIAETGEDADKLVRHEMLHIFSFELAHLAELWAGSEPVRQRVVEESNERLTTMLERMRVWNE